MLDLCLLGTGGMMPLPHRRLTSLMTRLNGKGLLIDCGEGTQVGIREKGWSFHDIDIMLLTHVHADHVSGIPGLLLSMGNAERTEPLLIAGPKGTAKVIAALRTICPELPFEVRVREYEDVFETFNYAGYRIEAFKVSHNIICYGYSIYVDRAGKFDPEKARLNDVPMRVWSKLQKGLEVEFEGKTYTQDMILGPERKGIKVTYCTDTRPIQIIADQAMGSDLFICEGMYGEPGTEQKAKEHKHMNFAEAAGIALQAQPKEMWLTHYSPSLVKPEEFSNYVRSIFPRTITAKDLRSLTIDFEEDE